MSVEKQASFWNSTKAAVAKLLGKSAEELTDTELVDEILETDKKGSKAEETDEKPEKKAEKPEKEAEKKEDTEGDKTEKNSELDEVKKTLADVVAVMQKQGDSIKLQGDAIKKITEFQAKRATSGEKEIEDKGSGRKYEAKHAPNFED